MSGEVSARAITGNSANITLTKEYLVIKGKHYQVKNGYMYRAMQTRAIATENILSMEYLTMRSKKLLILFVVFMTLVIFGGIGTRKMFSATRQIDRELQKVETVYNSVADEDIDINVTQSAENLFSKVRMGGIIVVYIVLVAGSASCMFLYLFKPYRVLYISTLGRIIAVERRFYNKSELDCVVKAWQSYAKTRIF